MSAPVPPTSCRRHVPPPAPGWLAAVALLLAAVGARADEAGGAEIRPRWPEGRQLLSSLEIRTSIERGPAPRTAVTKARLRVTGGEPHDGRPTATLAFVQLSTERMTEDRAWFFDPGTSSHDGSAAAGLLAELIGQPLPVAFDEAGCAVSVQLPPGGDAALAEVGIGPDVLLLPLGAAVHDARAGESRWTWSCTLLSPLANVPALPLELEAKVVERMAGLAQVTLRSRHGRTSATGTLRWHLDTGALVQFQLDTLAPVHADETPEAFQRIVLHHLPEGSSGDGAAELAASRKAVAAVIDERVARALASVSETRLHHLRNVLAHYRMQHGALPASLQVLLQPDPLNAGDRWVTDGDALLDAWDRPIVYEPLEPRGFVLRSLGADGQPGGEGPAADLEAAERR